MAIWKNTLFLTNIWILGSLCVLMVSLYLTYENNERLRDDLQQIITVQQSVNLPASSQSDESQGQITIPTIEDVIRYETGLRAMLDRTVGLPPGGVSGTRGKPSEDGEASQPLPSRPRPDSRSSVDETVELSPDDINGLIFLTNSWGQSRESFVDLRENLDAQTEEPPYELVVWISLLSAILGVIKKFLLILKIVAPPKKK